MIYEIKISLVTFRFTMFNYYIFSDKLKKKTITYYYFVGHYLQMQLVNCLYKKVESRRVPYMRWARVFAVIVDFELERVRSKKKKKIRLFHYGNSLSPQKPTGSFYESLGTETFGIN